MNLKSNMRRTAAVAVGALIGLTGVVALAGPASAHHPDVIGGTSCVNEDGTWQVTWEITNSESDLAGVITAVEPTPATSTVTGIAAQTPLPVRGDGPLTAVQTLQATDTAANLKVTAEWQRQRLITSSRQAENDVKKSDEKCKPTPTPSTSTPTEEPSTPTDEPSTPTEEPSTPTEEPSTPTDEPSTPPAPTKEPEFTYDADCDSVTVGITVPSDWPEDITVEFKTSEGDSKTVVAKRGGTTTVEFPAVDGMTITATPEGYEGEDATMTYETPADCETGGGAGGEEPSLPLTGAAAGSIAGGAALLLAVGVGLFFMARRRKVKFTA